MKLAPGMRFRFAGDRQLGTFGGHIGIVASQNDGYRGDSWWFTMEDPRHPDYMLEPRHHVAECYMHPVYPDPYGFPSVEQADAWLDSYTVEVS